MRKTGGLEAKIEALLAVSEMESREFAAALEYAMDSGKIQSRDEIDLSKCTIGIDSFILRNSLGVTIASISKRVLKEQSENAAAAKAKDDFNADGR